MNLWKSLLTGLNGLLSDANAIFVLICLVVVSVLAWHKVISDTTFAAFFATLPPVYCWTAHKVDLAQMAQQQSSVNPAAPPPPTGSI